MLILMSLTVTLLKLLCLTFDVLEADLLAATAVAAVQSDVNQNEADADVQMLLFRSTKCTGSRPDYRSCSAAVQADVDRMKR